MSRVTNGTVSVVIPYFQRQAGLLTAALRSVCQQSAFDRIDRIIVIDDGSPRAAELDIQDFMHDDVLHGKLQLIKQQNGGVSRARNRGLEAVNPDVEYVAFLDPDDVWLSRHLESALEALDRGSDFHFTNFTQPGQSVGAFERTRQINTAEHQLVLAPDVYNFAKDMIWQITTANLIGTSSVIYRFSKARQLRFSEQFTFAGEDYLMWLSLMPFCSVSSFTLGITVHCGQGVSLFSGATWGSYHLCKRLIDEINYRCYILENIPLGVKNYKAVREKLYRSRKDYINNALSMLKHGRISIIPLVCQHLLKHPKLRFLLMKKI